MQGTINRIITSSATPLFYCEHCPSSKSSLEFENDTIISNMTSDTIARATVWRQITNEMKWFIYDIAEAFGPPGDYHIQPEASNQKFSTTALSRDLKRCYKFLQPLIEVALAIYDWLLWRNPVHTLLLALVYTYSIARGWITSLILLLLWAQLTLNYMKSVRKIDIGLSFLPRQDVSMPKFNAVGAEVILDVAKIAQRLLNFCANFFEKLHSLFTWENRQVTLVFYCLVIYWLFLSLVFSTGTCFGMCGITLGIRIFITTYLFHRFPRLRKRLDTFGWFYRNLSVKRSDVALENHDDPLGSDVQSRHSSANSFSLIPPMDSKICRSRRSTTPLGIKSPQTSSRRGTQSGDMNNHGVLGSTSHLRNEEYKQDHGNHMTANVLAYRSCFLNDREKTFPTGISKGILCLTENALIYRPKSISHYQSPIVMPFTNTTSVKKIQSSRTIALLTGTRKSLKISMEKRQKPLHFIGLRQCDDFCSSIEFVCSGQASIPFLFEPISYSPIKCAIAQPIPQ